MGKPTGKRVKGPRPINRLLSTFGLKYTELGKYLRWVTLPARGKKKILNMQVYKSLMERIKSGKVTDAERQILFRLFKENFSRLIKIMKSGKATDEEKEMYKRILIEKFEKDLAAPKQTLSIFPGYDLADLAGEFLKNPTKGIALKIVNTLKYNDRDEPLLRFRLAAELKDPNAIDMKIEEIEGSKDLITLTKNDFDDSINHVVAEIASRWASKQIRLSNADVERIALTTKRILQSRDDREEEELYRWLLGFLHSHGLEEVWKFHGFVEGTRLAFAEAVAESKQ